MAEMPEDERPPESELCGSGASWWGGWIQAAKNKSTSAIEFVKKDITEFTSTMHTDSGLLACNVRSKLTQENAAAASDKVKHGVSVLLGGIKNALIIPPDEMEDDQSEAITISSSGHIFDRAQARLHAIQIDPETYCNDPTGQAEQYDLWKSKYDLDGKKGAISELLVSHVEVRALYTQLVPSMVSHSDFWQRYFFKMHQLDEEDQRRAELMKRVDVNDDDLAWDDEDDWENMGSPPPVTTTTSTESPDPSVVTSQHSTTSSAQPAPQSSALREEMSTAPAESTDAIPSDLKTENLTEISPEIGSIEALNTSEAGEVVSQLELSAGSASKDNEPDKNEPDKDIVIGETKLDVNKEVHVNVDDRTAAEQLKTKEKGDLVVVGSKDNSEQTSPSSTESQSHKESTDEDWEKDFDVEVTEDDIKAVEESIKDIEVNSSDEKDDDWENWE